MNTNDPDLDSLTTAWGGDPPGHILSEYRRLDRETRRSALKRISMLQKLTRGERPTRSDQEAAAIELGLGLKRLQALMRAWSNPNIAAITPGARNERRRTAPRPGIELAKRIIAKAVRQNPQVAEPTVHRRITAVCGRLACPPPARMTVRSLIDEARRILPPPDMDWIGSDDGATATIRSDDVEAGEVLVLTIETLHARVRRSAGDEQPGRALILADAATGHVLVAIPTHAVGRLARMAAAGIRGLEASTLAVWHPLRKLVLGPPTPDHRWETATRGRAKELSIVVVQETGRRTRRWTSSLLWRDTDELTPMPARRTGAYLDLPLYDEKGFEQALGECRDMHNARVNHAVDMRLHEFRRSKVEDIEAATGIMAALFPLDSEIAGE